MKLENTTKIAEMVRTIVERRKAIGNWQPSYIVEIEDFIYVNEDDDYGHDLAVEIIAEIMKD